jgi:hypothetical protein
VGFPASPFGEPRRLILRYRRGDPRFAILERVLDAIPEGERNQILLNCLQLGIRDMAAAGEVLPTAAATAPVPVERRKTPPPWAPVPVPVIQAELPLSPELNADTTPAFSNGAATLFNQF